MLRERLAVLAGAIVACAHGAPPVPPETAVISTPDRGPIEVALTFDDLPRPASDAPGFDRLAIHREVLAALAKHRVPPSYGFLNAGALSQHPEDRAALEAWRAAGRLLGNHTWSHARLPKVGLPAYLADVDRNEAALRALGGPEHDWKVFRFPFLQDAGGYRIAEVTIDFGDWAYGAPSGRCLAEGNGEAVAALRPIRHVALLHVTAFTGRMLDELLAAWERRGVRFALLEVLCRNEVHR